MLVKEPRFCFLFFLGFFVLFCFVCLFRASGGSQARGLIGAVAAGLHQRQIQATSAAYTEAHSNARSLIP